MNVPQEYNKMNTRVLRNSNLSTEQEDKILDEIKAKQNDNDCMTSLMVRILAQKVVYELSGFNKTFDRCWWIRFFARHHKSISVRNISLIEAKRLLSLKIQLENFSQKLKDFYN